MICSVKSSRLVKKSETSDLLMTHGFDVMIMNGEKGSFSRMMFDMADWKEFRRLLVDK